MEMKVCVFLKFSWFFFTITGAYCFILVKCGNERKLTYNTYRFFNHNVRNEKVVQQYHKQRRYTTKDGEFYPVPSPRHESKMLTSTTDSRVIPLAKMKIFQPQKHILDVQYNSNSKLLKCIEPKTFQHDSELTFFIVQPSFSDVNLIRLYFINKSSENSFKNRKLYSERFKRQISENVNIEMAFSCALTLRNSLLAFISQILYTSEDQGILTQTEYSAFFKIYDSLRTRKSDIFGLLKTMPKIKSLPLKQQLIVIMQRMKQLSPQHLTSSVNICTKFILTNNIETLTVNYSESRSLFSSIHFTTIGKALLHKLKPSGTKTISETFINSISLSIVKGELILNCNIFTGIMLNLQMEGITPEVQEAQLYLRDILSHEEEFCLTSVPLIPITLADPYSLVISVLKSILENRSLSSNLRECAKIIFPYLYLSHFHSEYHNKYRQGRDMDLKKLLAQVMTNSEFPNDVLYSKERILHLAESSGVNYRFNAHFFYYDSSLKILVSKLEQVRRQKDLPKYFLRHLEILRSHLIFKNKLWFYPSKSHRPSDYFYIQLLLASFLSPVLLNGNNIYQYIVTCIYRNKTEILKNAVLHSLLGSKLRDAAELSLSSLKAKLVTDAKYVNMIEKYLAEYTCFYPGIKQIFKACKIMQPAVTQLIILDFSSSNFLSEVRSSLLESALHELPKTANKALYWRVYFYLKYTSSASFSILFNSSHLASLTVLKNLIKYSLELRTVQENHYLLHSFSLYHSLMNPGKDPATSLPLTILDIKIILSYLQNKDGVNLRKFLINVFCKCNSMYYVVSNIYFKKVLTIDTFLQNIINTVQSNYWKAGNFPCVIEKLRMLRSSLGENLNLVRQHIRLDNITLILKHFPKVRYKNVYSLISNLMIPESILKLNDLTFNLMQHTTPTLFAYHCIVSMLRDQYFKSNSSLLYALKFYQTYLEYELQMFVDTVNFDSILHNLPTIGSKKLQKVKNFLTHPDLSKVLSPVFQMTKFRTVHALFQNVIKHVNNVDTFHSDSELSNDLQMYCRAICFCSKTYIPLSNVLLNMASEAENLQVRDLVKWDIFHGFLIQPELLTILGISYTNLCDFVTFDGMLLGIIEKALQTEALKNDVLLIDALSHFKVLSKNKRSLPEMSENDLISNMNQTIHNLPIINHVKYCNLMILYVKSTYYQLTANTSHRDSQINIRDRHKQLINNLQEYYNLIAEEKYNDKLFPAYKSFFVLKLMINELPILSSSKIKQYLVNFLSSNYALKKLQKMNLAQLIIPKPNVQLFVKKILQLNTATFDMNLNEALVELKHLLEIDNLPSITSPFETITLRKEALSSRDEIDECMCQFIANLNCCRIPDDIDVKEITEIPDNEKSFLLTLNISEAMLTPCNINSSKSPNMIYLNAINNNLTPAYVKRNKNIYKNTLLIPYLLVVPKCSLINKIFQVHNIILNKKNLSIDNDKCNSTIYDSCYYTLMNVNVYKQNSLVNNLLNFNESLKNSTAFQTMMCSSSASFSAAPHLTLVSSSNFQRYGEELLRIKDIDYPPKIRKFLNYSNLNKILGPSFNISQYYTPVLKLTAIVRYAKTISELQEDEGLMTALNTFDVVLKNKYAEIAIDKENENFNTKIYPNTTDEDKLWHVHRFFIQEPLSILFGELFSFQNFPTQKDKLRAITEHVMSLSSVQFKVEWYEAFENFNRSLEKHQPPPPPPFPITAVPDFARLMEKIPEVPNSDVHLPVFAGVLTYPNLMNILGSTFNVYDYPTPILKLWAIIKSYEESSMKFIYENVMGAMDKYKTAVDNIIAKAPNKFILEEMSDVLEMTNNEKLLRITEFLMSNNTSYMLAIKGKEITVPKKKLYSLIEYVMFLDSIQLNPKVYYSLDSFLNLLDQNIDSAVPPVFIENFPEIVDIFPYITDEDQYFSTIVGLLTKPDIIQQAKNVPYAPEPNVTLELKEQIFLNHKLQAMLKYAKSKINDEGLINCIEKYETALKENIKHHYCI